MIVTLTGPSCAGKTTLEGMLVKRGLVRAISTTTRPKRAGDVDGESYYFVTREGFEQGVALGNFVENVEFGGNYYGLSVPEVMRLKEEGKPIVVVCEPIGQKQIAAWCKTNGFPLYAVFVDNPEQVIAQRFISRLSEEAMQGLGIDEKTIGSYAGRMKEMMTTERGWVGEAWAGDIYNLRVSEFNEANCDEIADIVAGIAMRQPEAHHA